MNHIRTDDPDKREQMWIRLAQLSRLLGEDMQLAHILTSLIRSLKAYQKLVWTYREMDTKLMRKLATDIQDSELRLASVMLDVITFNSEIEVLQTALSGYHDEGV